MDFAKGQIVTVTRTLAGSTVNADAAATDTVLFLDDVSDFNDAGGSVTIDGDVYDYDPDSVDRDANTLTISTGLAGGLTAYEDFVAVYPEAPTHHAEVLLTDDSGVTVPARIPHWARDLLREGPRDPDQRESVDLLNLDDDWLMLDIEFRNGERDASTTPIIVTTDSGESVRIDGDGISTFTDDPVPVRTIVGSFWGPTTDGTYVYATDGNLDIRKFDPTTGVENTSGFPIVASFKNYTLTTDGTYLYVVDLSTSDIRKFNATTGVENLSGFPIAGTFVDALATDGTYVYAIDSSADIRKYNATTGVEDTGGDFPLVGSYKWGLATDGTWLYAIDSAADIRKFDVVTGVEDTNGFPIAGSFSFIDLDDAGSYLYAADGSFDVRKFDAATGAEVTTQGFPIDNTGYWGLAVGGAYIYTSNGPLDLRIFNNAANYQSTRRDSSDGTDQAHALTVSDLTATGDVEFTGSAHIDYLAVTSTKAARAAAQNIAHNTVTVIQPDTLSGSGATTAGDTTFWDWDSTNFQFDILQDGVYDLSAFVTLAANATGLRIGQLRVNGTMLTEERPSPTATTWGISLAASGVPLSAGNTVDITAFHTAGAGVNLSCAGSWLNIKRVGVLAA